ncbi:hypothetical protein L209DRAFT_751281 [Thermothelomyces heterothallicus CBS 203.75]
MSLPPFPASKSNVLWMRFGHLFPLLCRGRHSPRSVAVGWPRHLFVFSFLKIAFAFVRVLVNFCGFDVFGPNEPTRTPLSLNLPTNLRPSYKVRIHCPSYATSA